MHHYPLKEYNVDRMPPILLLGIIIAAAASTNGDTTSWRSDLPWLDELQSKLSSSNNSSSSSSSSEQQVLLLDTTPSNYIDECIPTFDVAWPYKTNHALINQPSGMCVPHLFCAFQDCYLSDPEDDTSSTTLSDRYEEQADITMDTLYSDLDDDKKDWIMDTSNPHYNLPQKVLFPLVASDVIAAVKFAKKHGLELSVKNSGHSYTAASTKKDTLLINMNKYTRYASEPSDHGITDCDTDDANATASAATNEGDSLSGQPCRLSLAKGKPAVIRVGGGENWGESFIDLSSVS